MTVAGMLAALKIGMMTGPIARAVLAWLTTGILTRKPTNTVPGARKARALTTLLTQHGRSDGHVSR